MKPSIVYKDASAQIVCPPKYLQPMPPLEPLEADTNYKAYSTGVIIDYLIAREKHSGLITCINDWNASHK